MDYKRIRITNNSGRKVNIINGDEITSLPQGERINVYTKADTLKFCYAEEKRMSLLIFKHPSLNKRYNKEIGPGFTLFFDSEIKTEDIHGDIELNERIYTYGHSVIFAFLKADIDCDYKLLWRNRIDRNIFRLIFYFTSLLWIVITGLLLAAGISILFEEFHFGYIIMCLIFLMLFVVGIKIFRTHRKFIGIADNTEDILLECKPVVIINSTKYVLEFHAVE